MFSFSARHPRRRRPALSGPQSRHRPPPRRARRLRARTRSAGRPTGDQRVRPAGDHRRQRQAAGAARGRRGDSPGRRGPAGRRPDRPGADPGRRGGSGAGTARRHRRVQRRQALAGVGRDLSRHAVVLPGVGVPRGVDAAVGHGRTCRLRDQRAVPARRARQGGYRGAVHRPRRIQVGRKPFHAGPLHRSPPRGRQPAAGQPARPGVAGGRRIPAHRTGRGRRAGRQGAAAARRRRHRTAGRPDRLPRRGLRAYR